MADKIPYWPAGLASLNLSRAWHGSAPACYSVMLFFHCLRLKQKFISSKQQMVKYLFPFLNRGILKNYIGSYAILGDCCLGGEYEVGFELLFRSHKYFFFPSNSTCQGSKVLEAVSTSAILMNDSAT